MLELERFRNAAHAGAAVGPWNRKRSAHVVGAGPPQAGLTQETIFGTLFAEIAANSKAQTAAW